MAASSTGYFFFCADREDSVFGLSADSRVTNQGHLGAGMEEGRWGQRRRVKTVNPGWGRQPNGYANRPSRLRLQSQSRIPPPTPPSARAEQSSGVSLPVSLPVHFSKIKQIRCKNKKIKTVNPYRSGSGR